MGKKKKQTRKSNSLEEMNESLQVGISISLNSNKKNENIDEDIQEHPLIEGDNCTKSKKELSFQDRYYRTVAVITFISLLIVAYSFVVGVIKNNIHTIPLDNMGYMIKLVFYIIASFIGWIIINVMYYCYLEYKVLGVYKDGVCVDGKYINEQEKINKEEQADSAYNKLLQRVLFLATLAFS